MTIEILQALQSAGVPAGAKALSEATDASQATVGRVLRRMEEDGLIEPVSNKGRKLTPEGLAAAAGAHRSDVKRRLARIWSTFPLTATKSG
jgi:DNA-binding IclR family transcriptional regulator